MATATLSSKSNKTDAPGPKGLAKPKTKTPRPTPETKSPPIDLGQASHVISRLTRSYKRGDLEGLVGLFTANARVNGGSGTAFIRSDYGAFFKNSPEERRLSIHKLRWRAINKGNLSGKGIFEIKTRPKGSASWRRHSGTIQFELLKSGTSYKISKMIYSYGP